MRIAVPLFVMDAPGWLPEFQWLLEHELDKVYRAEPEEIQISPIPHMIFNVEEV